MLVANVSLFLVPLEELALSHLRFGVTELLILLGTMAEELEEDQGRDHHRQRAAELQGLECVLPEDKVLEERD